MDATSFSLRKLHMNNALFSSEARINYKYIETETFLRNKDAILKELQTNGFAVLKNCIPLDILEELKGFWTRRNPADYKTESNIYLGQKNFTQIFFGKYTRHFDFLWNKPTHDLSREVSLEAHFLRNTICNEHPYNGLAYNQEKMGIYLAVTSYNPGSGEMAPHVDPNYFLPVHFVIPLSFKGKDFDKGGLYFIKKGEEIDVESMISPGDMLLFNGSIPHGVKKIEAQANQLGRLQMFCIPTILQTSRDSYLRRLLFEFFGKIKYFGYKYKIGLREDYKNFR